MIYIIGIIAIVIIAGLLSDFVRLKRRIVRMQKPSLKDTERPRLQRLMNWLLAPFGIF